MLIKGGARLNGQQACDLLYDGDDFFFLRHQNHPKQTTNGAGCTLSAAIAALLATDRSMTDAVQQAKDFVLPALKMGYS